MGGAGAFYYAVKYPELFSSVTAYAGTYHHFYHEDFPVGEAPEEITELYKNIMSNAKYFEAKGIFFY